MSHQHVVAKDAYAVGWVCALPLEMAAAKGMLDEIHPDLTDQAPQDRNIYILGKTQGHNVAIACLPEGTNESATAATAAKDMLQTFKSIRFVLLVGLGGGAPSPTQDIRLGDVVVSQPTAVNGGIIQFDQGEEGNFQMIRSLDSPPQVVLAALSRLQAQHLTDGSRIPEFLSELIIKYPRMKKAFTFQGEPNDCLFESDYEHASPDSSCEECDQIRLVERGPRDDSHPAIHYGNIASTDQMIGDAPTRDRLSKEYRVLCFETKSSGLARDVPSLMIRGISDYADSHKNNMWQKYAAATAAAFAKELLSALPPDRVIREKPVGQPAAGEFHVATGQFPLGQGVCMKTTKWC